MIPRLDTVEKDAPAVTEGAPERAVPPTEAGPLSPAGPTTEAGPWVGSIRCTRPRRARWFARHSVSRR
jgi:hypothetical protein